MTSKPKTDLDYVKLDPRAMGFFDRGNLPEADRATLSEAFSTLKSAMGADYDRQVRAKEIFWLNVWQIDPRGDRLTLADRALDARLRALSERLLRDECEENAIMNGYGFIVNPVGSKGQVWHVDYTTDAAVLWIPVTAYTEYNATQFVTLPEDTPADVLEDIASYVDEVDLDDVCRRVPAVRINQFCAQPMRMLYMGRGTIHRGIPNAGAEDRIGFYVSMNFIRDYEKNYPYERDDGLETGIVTFEDEMTKTA